MTMHLFCRSSAVFLYLAAAVTSAAADQHHDKDNNNDRVDYNSLPQHTLFPGPWEQNIKAPKNKSYITPFKIYKFEGATKGAETVLSSADVGSEGLKWTISPGGLITFEFEENISGKVCFQIDSLSNNPFLVLSYTESPFFVGKQCDATGDQQARDIPLRYDITHTGVNCVGGGYNRGGFKFLTVFMPEKNDAPTEGGYMYHEELDIPTKRSSDSQVPLQSNEELEGGENNRTREMEITISKLWVNCTAFPSMPNGRAYTGYFDSSSSLLNRIWYAGAYTLQLSTIDPTEGGSIIQFNRFFDHNTAPLGAWYSNYTISNGTSVTTDGAKRDRMVWPGDMTIAVPGIAVSTYDMMSVRNALNVIYDHQYGDGSMPYAGPPMGAFGEFSDTYHLHTLVGTYQYVLYSGDLEWLRSRWEQYITALNISINKVDETGLLHVTSTNDWIRPGMTGHNIEASSILYEVLGNSIKLFTWLGGAKGEEAQKKAKMINGWGEMKQRLKKGIASLYCEEEGMYADNLGRRGCNGDEKVLPQDGNSWALMSRSFSSPEQGFNISENLRKRWTKFGAPAVEFPNVISPFASSFELLAHSAVNNQDAAVELMLSMWGYMLNGPGMTNSTLLEGYRIDGYIQYPAYWSAARNSHAHGWSAGPTTVLTQGVLGIKLKSPMGKMWEIEPVLTKWLSYARGGFATNLGKFEVSIERMKSAESGRKIEALNVTYPAGTYGILRFGGRAGVRNDRMGTSLSIFRYLDLESEEEDPWHTWTPQTAQEYVKDDEWVEPEMEDREVGVVDWEKLERGYVLQEMKYNPFASSVSQMGRGSGNGDDMSTEDQYRESEEAKRRRVEMEAEGGDIDYQQVFGREEL